MRRPRSFIGPGAMGGMVSLWGANSLIESIQYGQVTVAGTGTGTAAITSVDLTRSVVVFLGIQCAAATANPVFTHGHVVLTNATTVTATSFPDATNRFVNFAVVQFARGVLRSLQAFSITLTFGGPTSGTATLTAVQKAKTLLVWGGDYINAGDDRLSAGMILTNDTTVTTSVQSTASGGNTSKGTALEFF